jgi:hypothetical protein
MPGCGICANATVVAKTIVSRNNTRFIFMLLFLAKLIGYRKQAGEKAIRQGNVATK